MQKSEQQGVANEYSGLAAKYDEILSNPEYRKFKKSEQDTVISLCNLQPADRLLDIGTGTGEAAFAVAKIAKHVVGIDISTGMITRANDKIQGRRNIEFHLMDAANLEFPDDQFDKVICMSTLHYCSDSRKALSEIHRVLKKDGFFCVSFITIPFEYDTNMIFQEITGSWPTLKHIQSPRYYQSTPELKQVLAEMRFQTEKFIKLTPAHSIFLLSK